MNRMISIKELQKRFGIYKEIAKRDALVGLGVPTPTEKKTTKLLLSPST